MTILKAHCRLAVLQDHVHLATNMRGPCKALVGTIPIAPPALVMIQLTLITLHIVSPMPLPDQEAARLSRATPTSYGCTLLTHGGGPIGPGYACIQRHLCCSLSDPEYTAGGHLQAAAATGNAGPQDPEAGAAHCDRVTSFSDYRVRLTDLSRGV